MRRSKYHSKWTRCNQGHTHQSKLEARYCNNLELLVRAKEIKGYRSQVSYEFWIRNKCVGAHIVDFLVETKRGELEVHEVKGVQTQLWQLKRRIFEALWPDIKYIVIKRRDVWKGIKSRRLR